MELNVKVEETSKITRKLTVRVPASVVSQRFERGLAEVQKTASLKGFRPGQAPISVIKQFYGEDVRHRVFHSLIDESYQAAVKEQKLRAVGRPKIETADEHKHGEGEHDHGVKENQDLSYTATVEVLPELEVKGYTGLALEREKVEVTDENIEQVVKSLQDSHAELIPASGGLVVADGSSGSRPVRTHDHVDITFDGGLVTDQGVERKDGMKGSRVLEIGSNSLIPGFEEQLIGLRQGETKTFRIPFPADFYEKELAGKEAEFSVTVNEVKEKKLPELSDAFAQEAGYQDLKDLRQKAHDYLLKEKTEAVDRSLRGQIVEQLIAKTPFEVPEALVEGQTRALAQDWMQELKRQGADDQTIQNAITHELDSMKKRAESQVRASLLLEAIAKQEQLEVKPEELDEELQAMSKSMNVELERLREFYAKNSERRDDLSFRVRQERTVKFLLDKAKIKSRS